MYSCNENSGACYNLSSQCNYNQYDYDMQQKRTSQMVTMYGFVVDFFVLARAELWN